MKSGLKATTGDDDTYGRGVATIAAMKSGLKVLCVPIASINTLL